MLIGCGLTQGRFMLCLTLRSVCITICHSWWTGMTYFRLCGSLVGCVTLWTALRLSQGYADHGVNVGLPAETFGDTFGTGPTVACCHKLIWCCLWARHMNSHLHMFKLSATNTSDYFHWRPMWVQRSRHKYEVTFTFGRFIDVCGIFIKHRSDSCLCSLQLWIQWHCFAEQTDSDCVLWCTNHNTQGILRPRPRHIWDSH